MKCEGRDTFRRFGCAASAIDTLCAREYRERMLDEREV
jgi:hypothetical protein